MQSSIYIFYRSVGTPMFRGYNSGTNGTSLRTPQILGISPRSLCALLDRGNVIGP